MNDLPADLKTPLAELLLALADDKLILGHRNSDWTGLAPILEEDIAFSALAQDEIGHANAIYQLVAPWRNTSADKLAFARPPADFRCAAVVELADEFDYGFAIARQLLCDHFDLLRLARLARSSYAPVAQLAARMHAEERNHVSHADEWVMRLGHGGRESRARVQAALDKLAPHAASLFEPMEGQERLESAGIYPALGAGGGGVSAAAAAGGAGAAPDSRELPTDMFDAWRTAVQRVLADAGLRATFERPPAGFVGGRRGAHTPEFAPLRSEMTEVAAADPEALW